MGLKDAVKRKKPVTDDYYVPADDAQAAELAQAERMWSLQQLAGDEDERAAAKARLDEVRALVAEEGVHFHIVAVGRTRFEELQREHPATDAQKAEHGEDLLFDPDTFWPALLSESVNPGEMTPAEWVSEVLESEAWNAGEVGELRKRTMAVNTKSRVAELGN